MSLSKALTAAAGNAGGAGSALYVEDVFSTYLYEGNGTGQTITNGISLGDRVSFDRGYVELDGDEDVLNVAANSAFLLNSDFTIEGFVYHNSNQANGYPAVITVGQEYGGSRKNIIVYLDHLSNPGKYLIVVNNTIILTGTTYITDDEWHYFALTRQGTTLRLFVNGTLDTSATLSSTIFSSNPPVTIASESFARGITEYTGKISNIRIVNGTALYTSSFSVPTSELTAVSGTSLLTCQGSSPFADNSGNAFTITQQGNPQAGFSAAELGAGGLVWIKGRSVAEQHYLFDTERGTEPYLVSNSAAAETSYAGFHLSNYNEDGFSVQGNAGTNQTPYTYASWTFRKAEKFFDVVTWTGDGVAGREIAHNLGSVPAVIITKRYDASGAWWTVYHKNSPNSVGWLNETNAFNGNDMQYYYGDGSSAVAPTSSVFTVSDSANVNGSGATYVAYVFASDAGGFGDDGSESIIKCGSFTYSSGNQINLGFEPQWLLIKTSASTGSWYIIDTMRGWTADGNGAWLVPNTADAEAALQPLGLNPTATGFKVTSGYGTGADFIYIAIRRPMKTPESGTEVFNPVTRAGTGVVPWVASGAGFAPDMALMWDRVTLNSYNGGVIDRLRMAKEHIQTINSNAEGGGWGDGHILNMDGYYGLYIADNSYYNNSSDTYIDYFFKRATGFFDMVAYTGDGTNYQPSSHNLGVIPELIITKNRTTNGTQWAVGYNFRASDYGRLELQSTAGGFQSSYFGSLPFYSSEPTAEVYYRGSNVATNASGDSYIAYLFATLAGVSKVGIYTGTGADLNVDCGFSAGARFILIKCIGSTGDWYVWDSARGIVAGNDPYLRLNNDGGDITSTDYIDPLASGFTITSSAPAEINSSGRTYLFLAIA